MQSILKGLCRNVKHGCILYSCTVKHATQEVKLEKKLRFNNVHNSSKLIPDVRCQTFRPAIRVWAYTSLNGKSETQALCKNMRCSLQEAYQKDICRKIRTFPQWLLLMTVVWILILLEYVLISIHWCFSWDNSYIFIKVRNLVHFSIWLHQYCVLMTSFE